MRRPSSLLGGVPEPGNATFATLCLAIRSTPVQEGLCPPLANTFTLTHSFTHTKW